MCELPGYHCTIVFPDGETLIIEGGAQPSAKVIPAGEDRPRVLATVESPGAQPSLTPIPTPTPTTRADCGAFRLPDGSIPPGCGGNGD